jgi:hypothetical protein
MDGKRPLPARIIAGALAIGGAPIAVLLIYATLTDGNPLPLIVFSPGWFAFFALAWAAAGKRLAGDPLTTWIPCILVNSFWVWGFNLDFKFDPQDSVGRYYVSAYAWAAVLLGVMGLILELDRRQRKTLES